MSATMPEPESGGRFEAISVEPRWGVVSVSSELFAFGAGALLEGYVRACARFQAAQESRREAMETFIPLFEALNWAASFELFMRDRRKQPLKDDLVHAFGFARNRVHHQWAAALDSVETPVSATVGVFEGATSTLNGISVDWFWKPPDRLPEPDSQHSDPDGERAYAEQLAGRPVLPTLRGLQAIFEQHV